MYQPSSPSVPERCVEHDERRRIVWLIEADSNGFSRMVSNWRAGFSLEQRDGTTLVTARSEFEPRPFVVRVVGPLVRGKFHQTQRATLAGLKVSVEDARYDRVEAPNLDGPSHGP